MIVSLEEVRQYLRLDASDDEWVLKELTDSAEQLCLEVLRTDDKSVLEQSPKARVAVMYAVAFLYEHREEADHQKLTLTLRALLGGERKESF